VTEKTPESKNEVVPTSFFLKQPKILTNLILMSLVWLATSFCCYLLLTLTNTFERVYLTALTQSFTDIVANGISGYLYERIGVKLSFIISFAISAFGGILILVWGLDHQESAGFFACFLLAKFGVTGCFNICYAANNYFFPTLFAATAFGICNFLARAFSSFSFIVSQLDEPLPMYFFTGLCLLTGFASIMLRTPDKEK
jgi:MFS family permease